ncbi:MAG: hypothetical protein E7287_01535 [Lachnospiraceae bacterium]|nr:hypothetical protein [Lachnospiraceae bacterium]
MEERCEKCGGELIEGKMAGMNGIAFYPKGELGKMKPKRSSVTCFCCINCGLIQLIRATEIDKLV